MYVCLVGWLVGRSVGRLVSWLAGWLGGLFVGWFGVVDLLVDWSVGWQELWDESARAGGDLSDGLRVLKEHAVERLRVLAKRHEKTFYLPLLESASEVRTGTNRPNVRR